MKSKKSYEKSPKGVFLTSNPQVRDGEDDIDDMPVGDSKHTTLWSKSKIIFIFNSDVSQRKSVWIILNYYINTKA